MLRLLLHQRQPRFFHPVTVFLATALLRRQDAVDAKISADAGKCRQYPRWCDYLALSQLRPGTADYLRENWRSQEKSRANPFWSGHREVVWIFLATPT